MRSFALLVLAGTALGCSSSTDPEIGSSALAPSMAAPVSAPLPVPNGPKTVVFGDARLESCVRQAIGKPEGAILPEDIAGLTRLSCQDRKIEALDGLEAATALTSLTLWENAIADVRPISSLMALTDLTLGNNKITDISPLGALTRLTRLDLAQNHVVDLSPLVGLTELEWLHLDHNGFGPAELEHLARLRKLTWLTLDENDLKGAALPRLPVQSNGEVYGASSARPTTMRAPAGGMSAGRLTITGLEIADEGTKGIHFVARSSTGTLPLHQEFTGDVRVRAGEIVWDAPGGRTIAIGRVASDGAAELCQDAYASACSVAIGQKTGTGEIGGAGEPVITMNLSVGPTDAPRGPGSFIVEAAETSGAYHALEDLALPSPNQLDADTCLFMSSAGAMEILLNQHTPKDKIANLGDTDLSERWLVNASTEVPQSTIKYFITDTIYTYNVFGGSMLDRDYPFVAGYMRQDSNGGWIPASRGDANAQLTCQANWQNGLPKNWKSKLVPLPKIERTTVFVDPRRDRSSVWNVGIMSDETIERIKHELRTKNAPVLVTYNHYLFWHQVMIVGYDDNETSDGCAMVDDSIRHYYKQKGGAAYAKKIEAAKAREGGCSDKGVFYVRDSIYGGGANEGTYDYGNGFTKKYSRRIVKHSYDWAKYLGNHAFVVHRL